MEPAMPIAEACCIQCASFCRSSTEKPSLENLKKIAAARRSLKIFTSSIDNCWDTSIMEPCRNMLRSCMEFMPKRSKVENNDTSEQAQAYTCRMDPDDLNLPALLPGVDLSPHAISSLILELKLEAAEYRPMFSSQALSQRHADDPSYATPLPGSQTEARAIAAHGHVASEVVRLVEIIEKLGSCGAHNESERIIYFGPLFEVYSRISDKVVGMLVRARKYGLLYFRGEILLQRRDDCEPVLLLVTAEQARSKLSVNPHATVSDFQWGSLVARSTIRDR